MNLSFFDRYTAGAYSLETGEGCMRHILEGKNRGDFDAVVNEAAESGAAVAQRRAVGENLFATLRLCDGDAVVSYFNYNHTLCIVTDELRGRIAPPLCEAECERLTTPRVTFLDLKSPEAATEGNGLGLALVKRVIDIVIGLYF